jgi:chemotaxis protein MotB
MMNIRNVSFILLSIILFCSCVSMKQFKDLQSQFDNSTKENNDLKTVNEKLLVESKENSYKLENQQKLINQLTKDTIDLSASVGDLKQQVDKLTRQYAELSETHDAILKGNARESSRLLKQLQTTEEDLQKKEDELKKTESTLNLEKQNLDQMKFELEKRNARMIELQSILARKDSSVNLIRQKVSNALLGMENEGLSVKILNGKVYVSLEEKLLFKSGSIEVEPKGINALKKLARVLDQNPDINITIEGHTDDVPVIGSASMKDNWDLSVKRATSIVRILLEGSKIDPKRLIASGRGEFMPVDPGKSAEARQKNRRTEIILTPRIDELLDILNDH